MKALMTAAAAAALIGWLAGDAPSRVDEPGSGRVSSARSQHNPAKTGVSALMSCDALCARIIEWPRWSLASLVSAARADEDCDNVVKALEEALSIANTNFDQTLDQLKKTMSGGADDKTKATVKNTFCSVGGEVLGASLAVRAVAQQCSKQRAALASLDKSIKEMETAIDGTCK